MQDAVFVDFETVATSEFNLKRMSTRRYIGDKRFSVLAISIAIGTGPVTFYWANARDPKRGLNVAKLVLETAAYEGKVFVSHNVGFDGLIALV